MDAGDAAGAVDADGDVEAADSFVSILITTTSSHSLFINLCVCARCYALWMSAVVLCAVSDDLSVSQMMSSPFSYNQ